MDIAEVTGLFNMSNRMASGLGWAPNPEYEYAGPLIRERSRTRIFRRVRPLLRSHRGEQRFSS